MTYLGKTFEGWNTNAGGTGTDYAESASYTVNANVTLYAKWLSVPIEPPGATFVDKLAYIRSSAGAGVGLVYDVVVNQNEYIDPQFISTMGQNVTVIIHSASSSDVKSIQLQSVGYLFSVDNNITLRLQDIVLKGMSTNNRALVLVGQGGKLILVSGSKVTQNTNTLIGGTGGGIHVNGGVLEINEGAEIVENKTIYAGRSIHGGGIHVENQGNVIIRGGMISENISASTSTYGNGGGVFITGNSTVTMSGGIISKNIGWNGGGIYVTSGSSFTKRAISDSSTSGIIYGGIVDNANTALNSNGSRGNAIYRDFSTKKERNSTLGYYDTISTISDESWEQ